MIKKLCKRCGVRLNDTESHTINTIKNVKGENEDLCIDCFNREVDRVYDLYRHIIEE